MYPQYLGFWRGQLTPSIRVCSPALATPRALLGGGVGVWAKLVASLAACQLPAICSVLLDWFGTGAPKRAAWLMGPHHKPVAVCNFALTPRRTSV